jgi:hypothetical protein
LNDATIRHHELDRRAAVVNQARVVRRARDHERGDTGLPDAEVAIAEIEPEQVAVGERVGRLE